MTHELAAQHGGPVICLDSRAIGKRQSLYASRPGPELNERVSVAGIRAAFADQSGTTELQPVEPDTTVTRVDIRGPLEQRSGYHDMCSGWSDGHDAVAERMIEALAEGNVLLVIDSPGGAAAGLQENLRRVQEAKATHGRKVIGYADEMIGSAAFWWAAGVCDEIYGPEAMIVGSVGTRSAHVSVAGALAKEGVAVTYFAAPGPGKVAFAPELPLSDLGRERGERDTWATFEMFAAVVSAGRGLSREDIVALNADALSGQLAVDAGLVDGVASLEDVMTYALALAGSTGEEGMTTATKPGTAAATSTEGEEPGKNPAPDAEGGDGAPEESTPDKHECMKCGAANDDDAKYCDKCGEPIGGATEASTEGDPDGDGDQHPPAPPPKKDEKTAARGGSLASIFGMHATASQPAIKTVAISYVSLGRAVMAATDTKTPDEAAGALKSILDDAAEVADLRTKVAASTKREEFRERMDLLRTLSAANIPGYARGDLFKDREVAGKLVPGPSDVYSEMKIGTLRGLVASKTAGRPVVAKRSPFEPSQALAKDAATQASVDAAAETPFVKELASRSTASAEQLARTAAALEAQGAAQ